MAAFYYRIIFDFAFSLIFYIRSLPVFFTKVLVVIIAAWLAEPCFSKGVCVELPATMGLVLIS